MVACTREQTMPPSNFRPFGEGAKRCTRGRVRSPDRGSGHRWLCAFLQGI